MSSNKLLVEGQYGVIPTAILKNKEITWKAKGLYAYMQSKPDGWDFSADRIVEEGFEGRDAVQAGLKELEKAGFLTRKKKQNELGHWEWTHILHEKQKRIRRTPEEENPAQEKPPTNKDRSADAPSKLATAKADSLCIPLSEEKIPPTPEFNAKDWAMSLIESPQPHIRLIGYYFTEYAEHCFPTKQVADDELKKNLKPAVYLLKNFPKTDITKTLKYCAENFSDVHWNLATVQKQITYVATKK